MKRKLPSFGLEEKFPHDYDTTFHWRVFSYGRSENRGKHKICRCTISDKETRLRSRKLNLKELLKDRAREAVK